MFMLLDSAGRILGLTQEEIGGTTGWSETSQKSLTAHTGKTIPEMMDSLMTPDGVPRFKFVGKYAEQRTQEEREADIQLQEQTPTQLDRIEAQTLYTALMTDTILEEV